MKRALVIIVIAAMTAGALLATEPPPPPEPGEVIVADEPDAVVAGVWHCPWVQASFEVETDLAIVTSQPGSATLTFPNPEPAGEPDLVDIELEGPGGARLPATDVALRGNIPATVETTQSQAAVAAYVHAGDKLAGDVCIGAAPTVWHLAGGSTLQGRQLTLRMFNPFPEPAQATVTAVSEFGPEPLPGLTGIAVGARSWEDIDFSQLLRLRETLSFTVESDDGQVLPVLVLADAEDEAMWPGSGLSREWVFPAVRLGAGEPHLSIFNPSGSPVEVSIDVFGPDGGVLDARSASVLADSPLDVPIGDLAEGAFGVRVRADQPVTVTAVASGAGAVTGTLGNPELSSRWFVPGAGSGGEGSVRSLWLLNPGEEQISITLIPVGSGSFTPDKVAVPPQSIRQYVIEEDGVAGYIADGVGPFSVAWSTQRPEGAVLSGAIPVAE